MGSLSEMAVQDIGLRNSCAVKSFRTIMLLTLGSCSKDCHNGSVLSVVEGLTYFLVLEKVRLA